ncbi:class I SAM-dependent methyltransferase [Methylobacterium sp. J-030]|uniref:class I SAM-dependent methyltransferase n=1 Tax=Methylobacterium sp. J-030 TaxID=2836627 RepID=UPI001FBAB54E|nr:class I SAM-dependent methyltransferase [Methylobacterium sp. J-030]MCJ2071658.1 class I SAM-dependent methyltransferase [Methylobacterium sp. J-030]
MTRQKILLDGLNTTDRIVEIGPSFNPLAPKRDGWNTFVIDHGSRDELIEKYHDQTVDRIEDVDLVWTGGSLGDAVPGEMHGTFDAFIASHAIEHTTDIIGFLRAAETLLRPDGIIILAIPDKRKCFDFYRHPSTTGDAIAAFEERRDRHDVRTHLNYGLLMAIKGDGSSWHEDDTRELRLLNGLNEISGWIASSTSPQYLDAHNWVFVPASFRLMILELSLAGYLDLRIERWQEQRCTEFFVWLRRGAERVPIEDQPAMRRALMNETLIEIADQTRQIVGSPLHSSWTTKPPAERRAPFSPPFWSRLVKFDAAKKLSSKLGRQAQ